jgi:acetylornithine deacetylase/succinyl-diaminopimelate desuccinylase-like protein
MSTEESKSQEPRQDNRQHICDAAAITAHLADGRAAFRQAGNSNLWLPTDEPPVGLDIAKLAHGADERIPVEALEFGANAIYQALQRFHE